jgi:hypothetical protein
LLPSNASNNNAPHTPGTIPGANSPQPPGGGIIGQSCFAKFYSLRCGTTCELRCTHLRPLYSQVVMRVAFLDAARSVRLRQGRTSRLSTNITRLCCYY